MKKSTLLLFSLFAMLWQVKAQTYLEENFDTEIPATWTITDAGGATGDSWISGQQQGFLGPNSLNGSNCAIVDSDANGNGTELIETLTSPEFDTTGATNLFLDFDQFYNNIGVDFAVVEVFDGTNWVELLNQTADAGGFNAPDQQSINITAYSNANMQVRFIYNDGNDWAWYWLVDNVRVYNATCLNPEATYDVVSNCAVNPEFFVEVNVTSLGSASTITLSDDQGSAPQTQDVTGIVTFGPYPNATPVVITIANDDDASCEISSDGLTQDFCFDNVVDCAVGPVNTNFCYFNDIDDDPSVATFTYTSSDGSPLNLTFNQGQMETCCDELVVIDSDGTVLFNANQADVSGLFFQSSGDTISWYVNSDFSVSCESSGYTPFDVTVACATCENPQATYSVVSNCAVGPEFFVEVDVTNLGSASTITLSDDQGSAPQTQDVTGIVTFGPYPNTTPVIISITNDNDNNCEISSSVLTQNVCFDNIVDCAVGPVTTNFCYFNDIDDDPSVATFTYTSSDGTPLNLIFNQGQLEGCCDELVVIDSDGTELFNDNLTDVSGLFFQSSGDTISWYVNSDFSVSCESSGFTPFDVTVSCATCINPQATYAAIDDCENGEQFLIDVDVTSLGDATSLTISNNINGDTTSVTNEGVYQIGPFPFLVDIVVTISNDQDANCVINSQPIQLLACPPDNDNCDGAITAVVNSDTSCDSVTPGTILAATPSGVPGGSCVGNPNDDVWFQFTALDEVEIISILNVTGGTFNIDHALYEGSCGALTELYCSNTDASVTPALVVGNTYYIRVFSGGDEPETSSFDLCIRPAPSNIICENAENFCSVGGALTTPNIIGIPGTGPIACLGSAPNPTWNIIQIGESGPIEIEIDQQDSNGNGIDVDFVVWGPFASVEDACTNILFEDCPTCPFSNNPDNGFYPFGNIVDCSFSTAATENLSIDDAQVGEIYMLLVANWGGDPGTITIEQTNASDDGSGVIDAEISAEITSNDVIFVDADSDPTTPVEANVCGFDSVTIETNSPFADEFVWYNDGFVIPGETSSTLIVTESSNYQVQAFDNQCGSEAFSEIVIVNLYNDAGTIAPQNITACDGSVGDGTADFDLGALSTSLGLGEGFTVSYYTNLSDANQALNPVSTPYNSSGETLIIRVEDTDAAESGFLGCRQISEVELVVNPIPPVNQPVDFIVCDDIDGDVDGVTEFDLTSINAEISTDTNVEITYHTSQDDADNAIGALASPYSSEGETIYVRAEDTTTGCYNTTAFNLEVNIVPLATFDPQFDYEVCPDATVPVSIGIVPTNFSSDEVSVAWFLDGNLISGNGLTLDTVLLQGDYSAEITFNITGCVNTVTTFVEELPACIFPQGISPGVTPGQNDNFDLSSFDVTKLEIFNRYGTLVYSKNDYTNEWEGQTNDGKELPVGTYFYTMEYEGGTKKRSAWVYINR